MAVVIRFRGSDDQIYPYRTKAPLGTAAGIDLLCHKADGTPVFSVNPESDEVLVNGQAIAPQQQLETSSPAGVAVPIDFTGLNFSCIDILYQNLDKSDASTIRIQVGVGATPTFLETDEYVLIAENGDESTSTSIAPNTGADTAPASGWCRISGCLLAAPKPLLVPTRLTSMIAWYINTLEQITAIRVTNSTASGTLTGDIFLIGTP